MKINNNQNAMLANYSQVSLREPYSLDFGDHGWLHPIHMNECLVYSEENSLWAILDCHGDIYSFSTLESAIGTFESKEGHQIWLECSDHWQPNFYFAQSTQLFKCILDYPNESYFNIIFAEDFFPDFSNQEKIHSAIRMIFLKVLEEKGYSTIVLNNRQIGFENAMRRQCEFQQDAVDALRVAISTLSLNVPPDPTVICNLEFVKLDPLPSNPSCEDILRTFHADDLKLLEWNSFLVPVLTPSRYTKWREVPAVMQWDGKIDIINSNTADPFRSLGSNKKRNRRRRENAKGFGL